MTSPNIPETLNKLLAIYAPISYTLMKQFPKAHGIHFFIREDGDYSAIPSAKVPPGYADGYSDKKFEEKAAKLLKSAKSATQALVDQSGVIPSEDRIGIHVSRLDSGEIRLRATGSVDPGYLFCYRDVHFRTDKEIFFAAQPAIMVLIVSGEQPGHADIIKTQAEIGSAALFDAVSEHKLMLDYEKDPVAWKQMSDPLRAAFPTEGKVHLEPLQHLFQCYVVSNLDRGLAILHSEAPENTIVDGMPDVDSIHFDTLPSEFTLTASPKM